MDSICVLSSLYPTTLAPIHQVFVQQLVWALADMGVDCTVISPVAVNQYPALASLPYAMKEVTSRGATVKLYFPKYVSFGQRKFLGIKTARLTTDFFHNAVEEVWKKLQPMPKIVYGHFLTPAGICASRIAKKYKVPAFAAFGESSPWSVYNYGQQKAAQELAALRGIVAVSSANYQDLEELTIFPISRVRIFPNAIRSSIFYPRDKQQARRKFGFDQTSFLVAFVGHFSERKGVLRVAEAVRGVTQVQVAYAGKGALQPLGENCVFKGVVKPEDIPDFLSAADVFVLPTLNEGCCNAIIEAMACGLPIISSDRPFNADILNSKNSILVDPMDTESIRKAILYMRDEPDVRRKMSQASLEQASAFTIETRASNIYQWLVTLAKDDLIAEEVAS